MASSDLTKHWSLILCLGELSFFTGRGASVCWADQIFFTYAKGRTRKNWRPAITNRWPPPLPVKNDSSLKSNHLAHYVLKKSLLLGHRCFNFFPWQDRQVKFSARRNNGLADMPNGRAKPSFDYNNDVKTCFNTYPYEGSPLLLWPMKLVCVTLPAGDRLLFSVLYPRCITLYGEISVSLCNRWIEMWLSVRLDSSLQSQDMFQVLYVSTNLKRKHSVALSMMCHTLSNEFRKIIMGLYQVTNNLSWFALANPGGLTCILNHVSRVSFQ